MDLPVIYALLASISYALFSRFYEPAVRKVDNSRHAAIILYALAGTLLVCLSGISAIVLPQFLPDFHQAIFFRVPVSGLSLWMAMVIGLLSMAGLYALHIETEATSRRTMNMGIYSVAFQLNVVIIALADFLLFRPTVSLTNWIGSAVILGSSIAGLLIHAHTHNTGRTTSLNVTVLAPAAISAISCGLALLVDGEMVRNFVFTQEHILNSLSLFFFYEALTFLIPSLLLFAIIHLSSVDKFSFRRLRQEFSLAPISFSYAALFSALQFVFSVLSLALTGPRLLPAAVLGIAPFLCVLLDSHRVASRILMAEIVLAVLVVLGIVLVAF